MPMAKGPARLQTEEPTDEMGTDYDGAAASWTAEAHTCQCVVQIRPTGLSPRMTEGFW